jgi:hypothetical protein
VRKRWPVVEMHTRVRSGLDGLVDRSGGGRIAARRGIASKRMPQL